MSEERSSFVDECLSGNVDLEDIDDFVEAWHKGKMTIPLHDFLGFNWKEYSLWVEKPESLPYILASHQYNISLESALKPSEGLAIAARVGDPNEARIILEWLEKTGRI